MRAKLIYILRRVYFCSSEKNNKNRIKSVQTEKIYELLWVCLNIKQESVCI